MRYKAVIFDLFETLITEWGHKKYIKSEMCSDLKISDKDEFNSYWDEKEEDRYKGFISFTNSILYACEKCGRTVEEDTLAIALEKRVKTKSECFSYVDDDVYQLLGKMRAMGLQLAVLSNCSSEEVTGMGQSKLYEYFDQVVLSCDVHMQKPDSDIYQKTAELLEVSTEECIFVGDGGSNELEGARAVGMKAIQAKWYTNKHPYKRESKEGFCIAETPSAVLEYVE